MEIISRDGGLVVARLTSGKVVKLKFGKRVCNDCEKSAAKCLCGVEKEVKCTNR